MEINRGDREMKEQNEKRRNVRGEGYSKNGDAWLHPEVDEEGEFESKVRNLVDWLASQDLPEVGNFYTDSDMRKLNLVKYFNALFWIKPDWMFIGEAPGVHGCVKTGIPFTSERLIQERRLERHFPGTRFVVEDNKSEASATVVWGAVDRLSKPPVMWNALPLHPRKKDGGNRPPTSAELEMGVHALSTVVDLFPGVKIISVGKKAERVCKKIGVQTAGHLIHPSYHAKEFREQFETYFFN
ncbi:hypothetical protein GNP92_11020 [Paenibacillus timonensis]|nr:hypothetical protein [Paenibacillus timonensis]